MIPAEIMEAARKVYFDRCDSVNRLAPQFEEEEVIDLIARAIMAATLAEREACALVLDAAADRQKEAWDEYIGSGGKGPATSFERIFRGQADAIRKRGEA